MFKNLSLAIATRKYRSRSSKVLDAAQNLKLKPKIPSNADLKLLSNDELMPYLCLILELELGYKPYVTQIDAALALLDGKVLQMDTGEGKTLVGALYAATMALKGKWVVMTTSNLYLAERDCAEFAPFFNKLGLTSSFGFEERNANIVYSTLVSACQSWLNDHSLTELSTMSHLNLHFKGKESVLLIDEADMSLINASSTPISICTEVALSGCPKWVLDVVYKIPPTCIETLPSGDQVVSEKFYVEIEKHLSSDGLYGEKFSHVGLVLKAYKSLHLLKLGVDYKIIEDSICSIDRRTGEAHKGVFDDFTLCFLHLINGLGPVAKTTELSSTTLPHYVEQFNSVVGMSGTLSVNKNEIKATYGLDLFVVPRRLPLVRVDEGYYLYRTSTQKLESLVSYLALQDSNNPILIMCDNEYSANSVHEVLREKYGNLSLLLSGSTKSERDKVVNKAGQKGAVTVTTRLLARGADIEVDSDTGELLVIGFGAGSTQVDDLQLMGRTARQGAKGTTAFFVSLDEDLFARDGSSAEFRYRLFLNDLNTFDSDRAIGTAKLISRLHSMNQAREYNGRKALFGVNKVISESLEVLLAKRLEISTIQKPISYLNKLMEVVSCDITSHLLADLISEISLDSKNLPAPIVASLVRESLGNALTRVWNKFSVQQSAIKSEVFINFSSSSLTEFKDESSKLFDELSSTLNLEIAADFCLEYQKQKSNFARSCVSNRDNLTIYS
nr:Protein translocase subunit SecA [Vibrio chagasii]